MAENAAADVAATAENVGEDIANGVDKAAKPAKAGNSATAGNYYLRAGNYYYTGERMVPPGGQRRIRLAVLP